MAIQKKLETNQLHEVFINALGEHVTSHSNLRNKPLDLTLRSPLPSKTRLYIFNATQPPGGRPHDEYKIQLIIPGQERGQRGAFDNNGVNLVLLVGYESELGIFILWDADLYPDFGYSRNVQVKAETIYSALTGEIGNQQREIKGQGTETVLTSGSHRLREAILKRVEITINRILSE